MLSSFTFFAIFFVLILSVVIAFAVSIIANWILDYFFAEGDNNVRTTER